MRGIQWKVSFAPRAFAQTTIRCIFHESDPACVIASYGKNTGLSCVHNGKAFIVVSEKDGWRHAYIYSRNGKELELLTLGPCDIEHAVVRVLEDNRDLHRKMESSIAQPTESSQPAIGNDVVLDAWMITPRGFDSSPKYPVFLYVYGEPHAQTVLDAWGRVHADCHRLIADLN